MRRLYVGVLVAVSFGSPLHAQNARPTPTASQTLAAASDAVRPGDIIRLRIWREPDLSGDFQIDEGGEVVLPRLGPTRVVDQSPADLRARLVQAYSEFLNQTSIEVSVLRRIQVMGAVKSPGLYPVDPTMTVGDILALAGGITPDGNQKKVQLNRDGRRLFGDLDQGTRLADTPLRSGDQLYVPYRSWLARNGYLVGTLASAAVTVAVWYLVRR